MLFLLLVFLLVPASYVRVNAYQLCYCFCCQDPRYCSNNNATLVIQVADCNACTQEQCFQSRECVPGRSPVRAECEGDANRWDEFVIILLVGATIILSLMAFLRDRYPWIRAIFEPEKRRQTHTLPLETTS
jgi:hypothetical protein